MRRSSRAVLAALALVPFLSAPARAVKGGASYDPEVALLVLTIQKQNIELLREELLRQSEWLGLGAMKVMLAEQVDKFARKVKEGLSSESDILDDYRDQILHVDPTAIGEVDRLVAEIRRYHDLKPGPPMIRLPWPPPPGGPKKFLEEEGVGADVTAALEGTPAMAEAAAYAERRFGTTGPFLRRRKWNLDFYLGSFDDLLNHYKDLGYRRIWRLRLPYVSYGKQAFVLAPEPGLRPRLVYCAFYGQDLFLHTRAQWAVLTAMAKGEGPVVRTLTCPTCSWTPPGVKAIRSLLGSVPYAADTVVVGYDSLFAEAWKEKLLGVYENDYWRVAYYRTDPTVTATLEPRHTDFGEILGASLGQFVRRGAKRVYFAGPAAQVDDSLPARDLSLPTEFRGYAGAPLRFPNGLAGRKPKPTVFAGLPSPLFATDEWLKGAKRGRIAAFDGEMARLGEACAQWNNDEPGKVECGIGAVLGSLSNLHPEEDRAIYTVENAELAGKEEAKRDFLDLVLARVKDAGRSR